MAPSGHATGDCDDGTDDGEQEGRGRKAWQISKKVELRLPVKIHRKDDPHPAAYVFPVEVPADRNHDALVRFVADSPVPVNLPATD